VRPKETEAAAFEALTTDILPLIKSFSVQWGSKEGDKFQICTDISSSSSSSGLGVLYCTCSLNSYEDTQQEFL
jgi:hypothetical protein